MANYELILVSTNDTKIKKFRADNFLQASEKSQEILLKTGSNYFIKSLTNTSIISFVEFLKNK